MIILWDRISFNLPSLALFFKLDPKMEINSLTLFDRVFRSNIGENVMEDARRENNQHLEEPSIFAYDNKWVVVWEEVSKIYSKSKVRKERLGH